MVSNSRVPPVFLTDPSSSTLDTSLSPLAPLHACTRAVTRTANTTSQPRPITPSDSFTIDLDPHTVVISVFHTMISPRYEGSAEGHPHIRKIMCRVRKLPKEMDSNATIKVVYFLVCSDDGSQRQSRMPIGWNKYIKTHDHRGDSFFLRVPVVGHYGTSCHSLPFTTELNHGWI